MLSLNIYQIVKQATRVQGNSANILDLVFLTDHFPSDKVDVQLLDGISDHHVVACSIAVHGLTIPSKSTVTYLDFKNADDSSVVSYLSCEYCPFEELANNPGLNVELLWHRFKTIIFFCIESYIPSKIKRTKRHNPWINREIIHAKRKVKRRRKLLKKRPNGETRLSLTSAITSMKSKIKTPKSFYLSNTLTFQKIHHRNFGIILALKAKILTLYHKKKVKKERT